MKALWSAIVVVLVLCLCGVSMAADDPKGTPLKIAMYSGSAEYKSADSLAELKKRLEEQYGASCALHVADEKGSTLKGIEDLADCDLAIIFTRRLKLDERQVEQLKAYCKAGKPIVGIRTASHAFQTWLDFDKEVLGGNYKGHYGEDAPAEVKPVRADHPVLTGVEPFTTRGKLYKNPDIAADATRLLVATAQGHTEPVAWTRRTRDGGRVFYTSLGTPEDFANPDFRRLLINAIFWSANREVPKPAKP